VPTNQSPYLITNRFGDEEQSVTCQAFFDTATFIATAGQTTFTLPQTPSGDIQFSRNGAVLADAAASVVGAVVTYAPAQNGNQALVAGDRIEISFIYNICTGGAAPTILDGSETKVIAGTGVTVTGSGTTGNPYVVSSSGGSSNLAALGSSIQAVNVGKVAYGGRFLGQFRFDAAQRTVGTPGIFSLNTATGAITVAAGYRYRITVVMFAYQFNAAGWTSWHVRVNGAAVNTSLYLAHGGYNGAGNNNNGQWTAVSTFDATAASTVTLNNSDGLSTLTVTYESFNQMFIEVVGVL
jgi:hypothetical protein